MVTCEMGKVYFTLDGSVESKARLDGFFQELGFTLVKKSPLGKEGCFNRVSTFTNNDGLTFDVIWFVNLAHIRIGEWGKAFIECDFTSIKGSYLQNSGHITLDFWDGQGRTLTLSVKREDSDSE